LRHETQDRPERQRPVAHHRAQGAALDQLHRDEDATVRLADLVDGREVRVRDRRRDARLAQESLPLRLVGLELRWQHLERHDAAELLVLRPVNDPHPALPDAADYHEMRELLRRSSAAGARGLQRALGSRRNGLRQTIGNARRRRVVATVLVPRPRHGTGHCASAALVRTSVHFLSPGSSFKQHARKIVPGHPRLRPGQATSPGTSGKSPRHARHAK